MRHPFIAMIHSPEEPGAAEIVVIYKSELKTSLFSLPLIYLFIILFMHFNQFYYLYGYTF